MAYFTPKKSTNYAGEIRTTIFDMPPEIVADFMSRLPIESILACKLVCSKWYSTTNDPYFIKLQLARSSSNRLLLLPVQNKESNFPRDHIPLVNIYERITRRIPVFKMPFIGIRFKCSHNGLVCVASTNNKADPLFLANPITGEDMTLPASKGTSRCQLSSYTVCLGSDSSGQYKIVRHYIFRRRTKESRLEILSLVNDSTWREIKLPSQEWQAYKAVFFGGAFFFFMTKTRRPYDIAVLAVDFQTETLQEIVFPYVYVVSPRPFLELVEIDGHLAVIESENCCMKVWIVCGTKVGDLYLRAGYKCCTKIHWDSKHYFRSVGRLDQHSYLLWHNNWKDAPTNRFARLSDQGVPPCTQYEIPDLPRTFRTMWITPSFLSPAAVVLGLTQ